MGISGCIWHPYVVGFAGGRAILGGSGIIMPWGLMGGVPYLIALEFTILYQMVS